MPKFAALVYTTALTEEPSKMFLKIPHSQNEKYKTSRVNKNMILSNWLPHGAIRVLTQNSNTTLVTF